MEWMRSICWSFCPYTHKHTHTYTHTTKQGYKHANALEWTQLWLYIKTFTIKTLPCQPCCVYSCMAKEPRNQQRLHVYQHTNHKEQKSAKCQSLNFWQFSAILELKSLFHSKIHSDINSTLVCTHTTQTGMKDAWYLKAVLGQEDMTSSPFFA